jgi:2-dehydro-3-deoxyphosphogluconate aldolase/(4S)-4-hydroxy-2-oxoglutarate aldolase
MGMGSNLITKELLAAKDWPGIEQKVRETVQRVKAIKAKLATK